jgi:hypothetical protein
MGLWVVEVGDPPSAEIQQMKRALKPWYVTFLLFAVCVFPFTRIRLHSHLLLTIVLLLGYFAAMGYFFL